jgi:hypothetical protein
MVWSWRFLVAELDGQILICGSVMSEENGRHLPLFTGTYRIIEKQDLSRSTLQAALSDVASGWGQPVSDFEKGLNELLQKIHKVRNDAELQQRGKVVRVARTETGDPAVGTQSVSRTIRIDTEAHINHFAGEWGGDWGELAAEILSALGRSKRPGFRGKRVVPKIDYPTPFGEGASWFAVRSEDIKAIGRVCGLVRMEKCSWRDGLTVVDSDGGWISPSIAGWTIVCSRVFRELVGYDDEDELVRVTKKISRKLKTDVQFFLADSEDSVDGGGASVCVWANSGKMIRLVGGFGFNLGKPTLGEIPLFEQNEETPLSSQAVLSLAKVWSLDPRELDPSLAVETSWCTFEVSVPSS